jgi:hypothetical protein
MSDIVTVQKKIQEALDAVDALRASLSQLVEETQPVEQFTTVSQPDSEETQKVPVVPGTTVVPQVTGNVGA